MHAISQPDAHNHLLEDRVKKPQDYSDHTTVTV